MIITNGRVIDPESGFDETAHIVIREGHIA